MKKLEKDLSNSNQTFEDIKHIDENGIEFWYARELQVVLDYKEWRKFENVINKAKESCENTGIAVFEHFVGADKTIKMPKGAEKMIKDYELTRYACYLIAQNGDKVLSNDKDAVREKIEDEYDLECYKKAIKEYKKNPVTYSIEEVKKDIETGKK